MRENLNAPVNEGDSRTRRRLTRHSQKWLVYLQPLALKVYRARY
ncbi:MAG TPA: hypothetical protein PLV87_07110 [Opitutaceae bacterium]|nr:hypothetical protein [Opitutaceae bacterium]